MADIPFTLLKRPRRNRQSHSIRRLIGETHLKISDFIVPFFIIEGEHYSEPIKTMPKIMRRSIDLALKEAEKLHRKGILGIALFPLISSNLKNPEGQEAMNPKGLIPRAIKKFKKELPSLCLITDIALDPYTSHGHDGIVTEKKEIDNDLSLKALVKQSLIYAEAGSDILAPSDMMDGRILAIRHALEQAKQSKVGILSYCVKYASAFYGPFREAIQTRLSFGDKRTYQMDPTNCREAIREALLDEEEGADMLLIKPALPYLDVIHKIREKTTLPIGAYHVSGEYSMVMASHEKGYLNAQAVFYETLLGIKRAGADFIFTYAIHEILDLL